MVILVDAYDTAQEASYATIELTEMDVKAIRAARKVLLALLDHEDFTACGLEIDTSALVLFWKNTDIEDDEQSKKMAEWGYLLLDESPKDLKEEEDVFCDGYDLLIREEVFYFRGGGDDGIMDTRAIPYSVLDDYKVKEEAA
jgi:hypothetical protein